jgi:hypothetical protein
MGIWMGIILALLLNNAILYKFKTNPPELLLYFTVMILGMIGGLLSCCFWEKMVILSTSVIGAYLFVRGISL